MIRTDIVRDRRWLWAGMLVVTLSAIAGVFWATATVGNRTEPGIRTDALADATADHDAASPVRDYLSFAGVAGGGPTQVPEFDADYVAEGLRKLAGALGTLNLGTTELQIDLRSAAEHVLLIPASPATTVVVREALIAAADTIEPEPGKARQLANSITPDKPLLDQPMTIVDFFREAAHAIQRLSSVVDPTD
jgi:hypothetical protein